MSKPKKKAFPALLYVWWEDDGGGNLYLTTATDVDAVTEGDAAIYQLKETGTIVHPVAEFRKGPKR